MNFAHSVPLLTIRNTLKQLQLPHREYMQNQERRKGGPYCHENVNLKNKQIPTKSNQMRRGNTSSGEQVAETTLDYLNGLQLPQVGWWVDHMPVIFQVFADVKEPQFKAARHQNTRICTLQQ